MSQSTNTQTQKLKKLLNQIDLLSYTDCADIILKIKNTLQKGADVNAQDDDGNTILHHLVKKKLKVYHAYIQHTLLPHKQFTQDYTFELPTLISNYKPNPFIQNNKGQTPSFVAALNQLSAEAQMLLSYENAYQRETNAQAFQAIGTILKEQQFKKMEQVVEAGDGNVIIERYKPCDHQPKAVLLAHKKLQQMKNSIQAEIQRGERS